MKLIAPNGCPMWINPTFEEALDIIASKPDTLRIGAKDKELYVVTGDGCTHRTIARALGERNQVRPSKQDGLRYDHIGRALVLFIERSKVWCNDEELHGEYTEPKETKASLGACAEYFQNLVEAMKLLKA